MKNTDNNLNIKQKQFLNKHLNDKHNEFLLMEIQYLYKFGEFYSKNKDITDLFHKGIPKSEMITVIANYLSEIRDKNIIDEGILTNASSKYTNAINKLFLTSYIDRECMLPKDRLNKYCDFCNVDLIIVRDRMKKLKDNNIDTSEYSDILCIMDKIDSTAARYELINNTWKNTYDKIFNNLMNNGYINDKPKTIKLLFLVTEYIDYYVEHEDNDVLCFEDYLHKYIKEKNMKKTGNNKMNCF